MTEMLVYAAVAVVMLFCTVADIRKKEISVWLFLILGITAIVGYIVCTKQKGWMFIVGILPGMLMLVLAKITEQSIGYGDGIILAEIGVVTGAGKCMLILAAALAMAGLFSLGIVVIKRVDKKYKIPFVPFLTAAYLIVFCFQLNGGHA